MSSASTAGAPRVELADDEEWSALAKKKEEEEQVEEDDDPWSNESDNEDPDGELGRLEWIERTKADIAKAVPHASNEFWNCVICGKQCLGTSFIAFPEKPELGSPSCNVHVFDCALAFRKQYDMTYDWEVKVGVPKPGFDVDGHRVEKTQ